MGKFFCLKNLGLLVVSRNPIIYNRNVKYYQSYSTWILFYKSVNSELPWSSYSGESQAGIILEQIGRAFWGHRTATADGIRDRV